MKIANGRAGVLAQPFMIPVLIGAAAAGLALFAKAVIGDSGATKRQFPNVPAAWWPQDRFFLWRFNTLATLKQWKALEAVYQGYATKHPDEPYSLLLLSTIASNHGHWEKAREYAERLDRSKPTVSVGAWRLITCCTMLGDDPATVAAARRFIELEPTSELVPHYETLITRLDKRPKRAAKRAKKPSRKPRAPRA